MLPPEKVEGTELSPGAGTLTSPSVEQSGDQGLTSARTAFSCSSNPSTFFPITSWSDLRPASSLLSTATSCSSLPISCWKLPRRPSSAELCERKATKPHANSPSSPLQTGEIHLFSPMLNPVSSPSFNFCGNILFYCILWESIPNSLLS